MRWFLSVAVAGVVSGTVFSSAQSGALRPLQEVILQENSLAMQKYVLKRCSALTATAAGRFESSGRKNVAAIIERMKQNSILFTSVVLELEMRNFKKHKANEVLNTIRGDILGMAKMYVEAMDDNYQRTGNALVDAVYADMKICGELLKKRKPS